ncbi:helix-turn-helix domain-containing protein [Clostridium gasigenes]|uniref:helix-turn-helix domain-containing protein n=1 Tax=Clostridium gasigenes TaxID=94869 RepID=UPI001C0E0B81|nr:helix-turn-helix transcriptional regulator [Clostridium gasigenes]MBU3109349.1 helix-turn-helix domain-containing protein [Clostridium gasigenes]
MKTLANNLIEIRKNNKLSQKELSILSGVSRSYISEIEKGIYKNISIVILCSICKVVNITPNELIPEHLYTEVE